MSRKIPARRARAHEVRVDEGRRPAVDVLEALPHDRRLVKKHLVRYECVQRAVRAGSLVQNGEMRAAEERDERAWLELGREREEPVVRQLRGRALDEAADRECYAECTRQRENCSGNDRTYRPLPCAAVLE